MKPSIVPVKTKIRKVKQKQSKLQQKYDLRRDLKEVRGSAELMSLGRPLCVLEALTVNALSPLIFMRDSGAK